MAEKELTIDDYKAILEWQGLGEIKSVEDAKTAFNKKFFTEDQILKTEPVKKKIGMLVGSINTELKNELKALGVELASNEIEEEDESGGKIISPKKIVNVGLSKLQQLNNKIQEDLKGQIGASNDEMIKKLQEKITKHELDFKTVEKFNSELKEKNELIAKEKEEALKVSDTKINEFLRGEMESKIWNEYPWADEANDLSKEGFKSTEKQKIRFELAEKDGNKYLELRDAKTGELIEDPTRKGIAMTPTDYLKMRGIEANKISPIYKINGDGGKKAGDNGAWYDPDKNGKKNPDFKPQKLAINTSHKLPSTAKGANE